MPEGSEFHTEGAATLKLRKQKLCGLEEMATDWCWRSIENVLRCGSYRRERR